SGAGAADAVISRKRTPAFAQNQIARLAGMAEDARRRAALFHDTTVWSQTHRTFVPCAARRPLVSWAPSAWRNDQGDSGAMTRINPRRRMADGLDIRYAESAEAGDETILLLNPWPESL